MPEKHWCKEHKTVWFRKGKMKGYAHPLLDPETGEETGEWCNEPEEKASKPDEMTKEDWAEKDKIRSDSIEIQNAYTGVISLMVSGVIKKTDQLGQTATNYAASKLSQWASMGEVEEAHEPKPKEPKATKEQGQKIKEIIDEMGYSTELAQSIMVRECGVSQSKELNQMQAALFIEILLTGKHLGKPEEKEPEDLPF